MGNGTQEIDAVLVQRMVELVRDMTGESGRKVSVLEDYDEAHAIAALLPKPVDPARIACAGIARQHSYHGTADALTIGKSENFTTEGCMLLAAYHAGEAAAKAREESK